MKKLTLRLIVIAIAVITTVELSSCKSKKTETNSTPTITTDTTTTAAPVEVANDEALLNGVKDATKDYPTVTASVNNGEVTLTGKLERDKLPKLLQSIHSLNPRKVNTDQLTLN